MKKWEDWYAVKKADVIDYGGDVVLKSYYGNSLKSALIDLYPEHPFTGKCIESFTK